MTAPQVKRLGEIATVIMGQSPPGDTYNSDGNGLPFFQGKAEFGEESPTPVKWCTKPSRIAEAGDILMSVRAPVGPTNYADQQCCIGRGLAAIRAHKEMVNQRYLGWFLKRFEADLARKGVGSTFSAINRKDIEALEVPVPPLTEQERIVRLLDEADSIRKLRAKADQRTADLIPALFHHMFGDPITNPMGWPVKKLGEVSSIEASLVDPTLAEFRDLPHVGADRIESESGRLLPTRTAAEDHLISSKFLFGPEDVLYSKIRPSLRKAALPTFRGLCSADVYPLRPSSEMTREYLWVYLLSDHFTAMANSLSARANMPKLNRTQLESITVLVPPVEVQQQFQENIREVTALSALQDQARERQRRLSESMLGRLFRG